MSSPSDTNISSVLRESRKFPPSERGTRALTYREQHDVLQGVFDANPRSQIVAREASIYLNQGPFPNAPAFFPAYGLLSDFNHRWDWINSRVAGVLSTWFYYQQTSPNDIKTFMNARIQEGK